MEETVSSDLFEMLRGENRDAPIVLILDDAHHAGPEDFAVLEKLFLEVLLAADGAQTPPSILLIAAAGEEMLELDGPLETFAGRMETAGRLDRWKLSPLDRTGVEKMVISMLGAPAEGAMVDAVYAESAGNPLFVYEMVRHGTASGRFTRSGTKWCAAGSDLRFLPERITRMILGRYTMLPKEQQELLKIAAMTGDEFEGDIIEGVYGGSENEYLDAVGALIRRRYIHEIPHRWDRFRFAHSRLRSTILAGIPEKERAGIGIALARRMMESDDLAAREPGRIAALLETGGAYREAGEFRWRAFHRCLKEGLQAAALEHLEIASTHLDRCGLPADAAEKENQQLALEMGRLERRLGMLDRSRLHLVESHRIAAGRKDLPGRGLSLLHLGGLYGQQGTVASAERVLRKAAEIFHRLEDGMLLADAYSNLGAAMAQAGRYEDSLEHHRKALEICREEEDCSRRIRCMVNLGMILTTLGKLREAMSVYRKALILARQHGEKRMIAFCLSGIASLHIARGLTRKTAVQTAEIAREAVAVMARTGDRVLMADCLFKLARARKFLGRPHRQAFDKAFQIARELGINSMLTLLETWQSHAEKGEQNDDNSRKE